MGESRRGRTTGGQGFPGHRTIDSPVSWVPAHFSAYLPEILGRRNLWQLAGAIRGLHVSALAGYRICFLRREDKVNYLFHQDQNALREHLASALTGIAVIGGLQLSIGMAAIFSDGIVLLLGVTSDPVADHRSSLALLILITLGSCPVLSGDRASAADTCRDDVSGSLVVNGVSGESIHRDYFGSYAAF